MSSLKLISVYAGPDLGTAFYPPGAVLEWRTIDFCELVWIQQGHVIYQRKGFDDIEIGPNDVLIAQPGPPEKYIWDSHGTTRLAFFHFQFKTLPADWPAPKDWPQLFHMRPDDVVEPLFRYIINNLPREWIAPPWPAIARALEMLLSAVLVGPRSTVSERNAHLPDVVDHALYWLKQQVRASDSSQVTLKDIAAAAHVSPKHLCRLFRESLKTTPMEVLMTYRVVHSLRHLAYTRETIEQIGTKLGFSNGFHFSRRFRQLFRVAPGAMRQRLQGGYVPPLPKLPYL